VYVADTENHCVRKIDAGGAVTTIGGSGAEAGYRDGPAAGARFRRPSGVAVDGHGNVYVADTENHCVRKIDAGGAVTTIAAFMPATE
jgi:DNA-binding beta-propeller fold protein YncE